MERKVLSFNLSSFKEKGKDVSWLRFIECDNKYYIEKKSNIFPWKWKAIKIGPFGPSQYGIEEFTNFDMAMKWYIKCLELGKKYTNY